MRRTILFPALATIAAIATLLTLTSGGPAYSTVPGFNGKIAFETRVDNDNFEIFAMNPNGTNLANLTNSIEGEFDPAWSPDGSKIAFHLDTNEPLEDSGIWVMDADGSNRQQVTEGADFDPTWSPDGTQLAFNANRGGVHGVYILDLDTLNVSFLTENSGTALNGGPDWSPDGTRIVHGNFDIRVTNVDGSGEVAIADGTAPAWSPDGNKIAFLGKASPDSGHDIFLVNPDGTGLLNLTESSTDEGEAAWSPDGTRIVYTAGGELWMMNSDGTGQTEVTFTDSYAINPHWQPLAEDPGFAPLPLATPTPTPATTSPADLPPTGGAVATSSRNTTLVLLTGAAAALTASGLWLAFRHRRGQP